MTRTQLIHLALVQTLTQGFLLGCGASSTPPVEVPVATCAEGPEDIDGFQDDDGCADLDDDHDGIADARDQCPCAPEDVDGVEDEDGCPDPDNDHDCFHDACDACPMEAEIYNGEEDNDGCPDRGRVLLIDERILILERVYFRPRATQFEPRLSPIVEAVAATMVGNPQLHEVAVVGRATRQEGERVARARAQGVIDLLVARGVEPARLTLRTEIEGRGDEARQVWFEIVRADEPPPRAAYEVPACAQIIRCDAAPTFVECHTPSASPN